jgi:hypothetical protein
MTGPCLPPHVPIYSSMDELVAAKVCDAALRKLI